MIDSVFIVDPMINFLVQKLRQEKAECEEAISQTKQKARPQGCWREGWRRWPDRWGRPSLLRKVAMMAVLKGRVGGGQAEEDCMERGVGGQGEV